MNVDPQFGRTLYLLDFTNCDFVLVSVSGGTLSKSSREYRTPPAVAPPQVPSHYAPNYPMGHPRRERGPGYSALPMAGAQPQPQVFSSIRVRLIGNCSLNRRFW